MSIEKQRSFSFKRTKFFVFTSTVSISIIFLTIFSFWVFKSVPFISNQETHFQFHEIESTALNFVGKPFNSNSSTRVLVNLSQTHFSKPFNSSNLSNSSKSATVGDERPNLDLHKIGEVNATKLLELHVNVSDLNPISVQIHEIEVKKGGKLCDVTKGKWVYDDSYPLYSTFTCPFIDEGFDCEGNGRLDKDYMKWRWKPHDCDIPR